MEGFETISLKDLLNMVWNHRVAITILVILFTIAGFVYTFNFVTPMYSSSTTLVLVSSQQQNDENNNSNSITTNDITLNSKLVSTYSELIKSKTVLRQVKLNLGNDTEEKYLKKNIKVNSVKDTEILEITVSNENPSTATEIANEIAKVFAVKVQDIYHMNNVEILDKAEDSEVPSNVNHKKDIILFIFLGVACSAVYVWLASLLDTTVKSTDDLEKKYKVPVLASIPIYTESNIKKKGEVNV